MEQWKRAILKQPRSYGKHIVDPVGKDIAQMFPPFMPDVKNEHKENLPLRRAFHGAAGGLFFGCLLSIPTWIRSRKPLPPAAVLYDIAEMTGISASSEFIECSIERFRGRSGDLVAPLLGSIVPRVALVSVSTVLASRRGEKPSFTQFFRSIGSSLALPLAQELLFRLPSQLK